MSLEPNCFSNKNIPPVVPRKKVIIRGQIISSKFVDIKQLIPSYIQTKSKPEINLLVSMEYAKIWQDKHDLYEKSVIEQLFIKKKKIKTAYISLEVFFVWNMW
jgi:hypothetical protein